MGLWLVGPQSAKRAEYEGSRGEVRDGTPPSQKVPAAQEGVERLGGKQVPVWDLGSSTHRGWPFLPLVWLTPLSPLGHTDHPGPTWGAPTLGDSQPHPRAAPTCTWTAALSHRSPYRYYT